MFRTDMCILGRVRGDSTPDIDRPIKPGAFVDWYYNAGFRLLADASPALTQTIVNQTCSTHFECVHDYLIVVNTFRSEATALALDQLVESRVVIGKIQT